MRGFWRFLLRRSLPLGSSLPGLRFAVFGLGDSGYPQFNVSAGARTCHHPNLSTVPRRHKAVLRRATPCCQLDDVYKMGPGGGLVKVVPLFKKKKKNRVDR
jgi:hypothetical protein